jgi:enediyne polyketide synthase
MTPCAAPLRSVLAQVPFRPPRRRLLSTVTGRELTARDDIAALLCAQLTSPVRFREALQAAADGADLILLVGADEALAAAAAGYGVPVAGLGAPVARFPAAGGAADAGAGRDLLAPGWLAAEGAAALFTAGAMPDVTDLAPEPAEPADVRPLVTAREAGPGPGRFLENVTGQRMRDAGPLPGSGPADGNLLPPDAQPAGVAADLEAFRPAAVPQQQVESLSRAR